jgi:hypothetical protein
LFSAVCAFTLVSAAGCGTDAQGVDDCRDIEQTRCAAAKNCGLVSDVAECQRYYRDQCLHGLAVKSPGSSQIKACVTTIRAAGVCAASGMDTALSDCDGVTGDAPGVVAACEIVNNPEKASECAFLAPDADAGTAGSGSGGARASGGSSGAAGDESAGAGGT